MLIYLGIIYISQVQQLHRTETALLKITNGLLLAADSGSLSMLLLVDLTATFGTVSHNILLDKYASLTVPLIPFCLFLC